MMAMGCPIAMMMHVQLMLPVLMPMVMGLFKQMIATMKMHSVILVQMKCVTKMTTIAMGKLMRIPLMERLFMEMPI